MEQTEIGSTNTDAKPTKRRTRSTEGEPPVIALDPPVEHATNETRCVLLDAFRNARFARSTLEWRDFTDETPAPEDRALAKGQTWFAARAENSTDSWERVIQLPVTTLGVAPPGCEVLVDPCEPGTNAKWIRTRVAAAPPSLRAANVDAETLAYVAREIGAAAGSLPISTSTADDGKPFFHVFGHTVAAEGLTSLDEMRAKGAKHAIVEVSEGQWSFVVLPVPPPPAADSGDTTVTRDRGNADSAGSARPFVASSQGGQYNTTYGHHPSHAR